MVTKGDAACTPKETAQNHMEFEEENAKMANVKRVYAEKKPAYAVKAEELMSEIKEYLNIQTVTGVRVLVRYDVENVSEDT